MPNLIKKIQNSVFENSLFGRNAKIVLAISGGPDSVCLLDVFYKLQKKYDLQLIITHVNYNLRGKDSQEDERFVKELAKKYNLKIEILKPEIKSKINLENNLRDIRYDFFEKIRQGNNFDWVAVAHNADDQAETFLMRILRGAGLQGLSAMKYKSAKIIRPLLNIPRQEILEYLKENKLKYRIDKTNLQSVFLRNKIRNKLIPYLEKNYNPNIKKTIFNSTVSIAQDYSFINELTEKVFRKNKELTVKKILALHPALQKRVLLQIISEKKLNAKNIEFAHIEEIIKALKSSKGKNQTVNFAGLKMTRKGDRINLQ